MLPLFNLLHIPEAQAGTLFTLPTATDALAQVGSWSSPLVTDFLPIIYIGLGIAVLGIILALLFRR